MVERRRFSRILYRAPALITQGDEIKIAATVQDLSLHGGLFQTIDDAIFDTEKEVMIELPLPESDIVIHFNAMIVGLEGDSVRVQLTYVDIESIAHLRRLVELNVGNDKLLHRELEQLSDLGAETES